MRLRTVIRAAAIAAPLAFFLVAEAPPAARAEMQGLIAVANDHPITELDITQRLTLLKEIGDMPANGMTRAQALQNLIDDQVKLAEATRLMMVPTDAEVTDRIDRVAKSMKLSRAEFIAKLKKAGVPEAALRSYLQVSLAFSRIISVKYREAMTATPTEVDAKMAEIQNTVDKEMARLRNDPRMKAITVYSLMEISLPLDSTDPMLLQSRAIEAQQVVQRFKGCGKAKAATAGVFNVKIGKPFDADGARLPKPMKQAMDKVGPGRAIGPMRSKEGIQLIAFCGTRKITPPKPDFTMPTREQVERMVVNQKYDKLEADYLKEARDKIYVEYRNGNNPLQ